MQRATESAGCAEMQRLRKIGYFLHFGETGDEPDTFYFLFPAQYSKNAKPATMNCGMAVAASQVNQTLLNIILGSQYESES